MPPETDEDLEAALDALQTEGVPEAWQSAFKRVRSQVAAQRTQLAEIKPLLDVPDVDRTSILDFVKTYRSNPGQGAAVAVEWAKALAGDKFNDLVGAPTAPAPEHTDEGEPPVADMTPEQYTKMVKDEIAAARADIEKSIRDEISAKDVQTQIASKLKDLGYKPSEPKAKLLLLEAQALGGDPLDAIDKAFEALDVSFKPVADAAGTKPTTPPDAGGAAPEVQLDAGTTGTPPPAKHAGNPLADGHDAAAARISDMLGAAPGFE